MPGCGGELGARGSSDDLDAGQDGCIECLVYEHRS